MRLSRSVLIVLAMPLGAQAGVVLETAERDLAKDAAIATNTLRADGGRLRMERYEDGSLVGITIFKDDALYALDPTDKRYAVLDRETIERVAAVMNPALQELESQIAKMSPDQRAMVEQMLEGSLPDGSGKADAPPREVRRTDRTDEVAEIDCRVYEVLEGSTVIRDACVAPASAVPGGQDFYAALSRMGALMQEMLDAIDAPWLKESLNDHWTTVTQLEGVPLRGREFKNGEPSLEVVVTRAAEEAAPIGSFDVPSDYTQRDLDSL